MDDKKLAEVLRLFVMANKYPTPARLLEAADRIESLTAQLAESERQPVAGEQAADVGGRIRKSDESLAEFLASGTPDEPWPHCTICVMHKPGMCTGDTDCKRALLWSLSRPPEKGEL